MREHASGHDHAPAAPLQHAGTASQTAVQELQTDLMTIDCLCPLDGTFDDATEDAVKMLQEHFSGGTRPRPAHSGQVDEYTAEVIKRVR